jgi:hypothetical protein
MKKVTPLDGHKMKSTGGTSKLPGLKIRQACNRPGTVRLQQTLLLTPLKLLSVFSLSFSF